MAELIGLEVALPLIFRTILAIKEVSVNCEFLPECAHELGKRVSSFETQLRRLQEHSSKLRQFGPAIQNLKDVLLEIQHYLEKLASHSNWARKVIKHQSMVDRYKILNRKLDRCRDDLQFEFIANQAIMMTMAPPSKKMKQAYEDDLKVLIQKLSSGDSSLDTTIIKRTMEELVSELQHHSNSPNQEPFRPSMVVEQAQVILNALSKKKSGGSRGFMDQFVTAAGSLWMDSPQRSEGVLLAKELDKMRDRQIEGLFIDPGRLSLVSTIGKGGFGDVYIGTLDGNQVAIKVVRPNSNKDEEKDLLEEVRTQHICSFAHVVQVYGFTRLLADGNKSAKVAAIMEYASCGSLDDFLSVATGLDGRLKAGRAYSAQIRVPALINLLYQMVLGMEFLHDQCVVHRDIKPSNILLDGQLRPKLCDFGLARETSGHGWATRSMTGNIGTFNYMAPEMIQLMHDGASISTGTTNTTNTSGSDDTKSRARYTYTVDAYSMGVVILEACQKLFGGYQNRPRVPKKDPLPADFPSRLTAIKNRCLDPTGRNRYGRGSDDGILLSLELKRLLAKKKVTMHPALYRVAKKAAMNGRPDDRIGGTLIVPSSMSSQQANSGGESRTQCTANPVEVEMIADPELGAPKPELPPVFSSPHAKTWCHDSQNKKKARWAALLFLLLALVFVAVILVLFVTGGDSETGTSELENAAIGMPSPYVPDLTTSPQPTLRPTLRPTTTPWPTVQPTCSASCKRIEIDKIFTDNDGAGGNVELIFSINGKQVFRGELPPETLYEFRQPKPHLSDLQPTRSLEFRAHEEDSGGIFDSDDIATATLPPELWYNPQEEPYDDSYHINRGGAWTIYYTITSQCCP